MGIFVLTLIILLLVLLLTGTIGPLLIVSLKVIGWFIVAVLVLVLLWMLISIPLNPIIEMTQKFQTIRDIKGKIKYRRKLGYDTQELEIELEKARKKLDKGAEHISEIRRNLGYDDNDKS